MGPDGHSHTLTLSDQPTRMMHSDIKKLFEGHSMSGIEVIGKRTLISVRTKDERARRNTYRVSRAMH